MSTLSKIFGIDLGTTYSCIAYVDEAGKPVIVKNGESERITPSVVFFDGDNVVVGNEAKNQSRIAPDQVVELAKRHMGEPEFTFNKNGKDYRPEEVSAFVLRKVVGDAEKELNEKITDVVITCPAYFGVNEREATAKAGELAGLNVRCVVNEPTAAAIAYGMNTANDQVVLVYDLGGGTFDITMIEVKTSAITVVCTDGNHKLGGKDWDHAVVEYFIDQFREQTGSADSVRDDRETMQDLYLQAEQAKKTLTQRDKTKVSITHGGQRIPVELTREKFDEVTAPLLAQTIELTRQMLAEGEIKGYKRYDKILLVGGSTRMPQVQDRIKMEFPGVAVESFDPDESVAKGAAIYGWKLALDQEIKTAIAAKTGQAVEDVQIDKVDKATRAKAEKDVASAFNYTLSSVQNASQKEVRGVSPKTFGVVAWVPLGGDKVQKVVNLIRRNDQLPVNDTMNFGTHDDNQQSVSIELMENLSIEQTSELNECTPIGTAELPLPPGLPGGSPIEIFYRLNEQGRLEVTAKEPLTGKTVDIEVQTGAVMSNEAVQESLAGMNQVNVS